MFDASQYTCVRCGVNNVYLDEKLKIDTIKEQCQTFWNNHLPGERKTMYRGHCLVSYMQHLTNGSHRSLAIFAFDCRLQCMRSFGSSSTQTIEEAKQRIDDRIDNPTESPLEYSEEEVEVEVTVKVIIGCFRDTEGFLSNGSVVSWDQIDSVTHIDQNDPGEKLRSIIACKALDELR